MANGNGGRDLVFRKRPDPEPDDEAAAAQVMATLRGNAKYYEDLAFRLGEALARTQGQLEHAERDRIEQDRRIYDLESEVKEAQREITVILTGFDVIDDQVNRTRGEMHAIRMKHENGKPQNETTRVRLDRALGVRQPDPPRLRPPAPQPSARDQEALDEIERTLGVIARQPDNLHPQDREPITEAEADDLNERRREDR